MNTSQSKPPRTRNERQGSVKFTDPFAVAPRPLVPILVRRGKSIGPVNTVPRSPMINLSRSPITARNSNQHNSTRVPPLGRSTTLTHPAPHAPSPGDVSPLQHSTNMAPVRNSGSTLPQPRARRSISHKRSMLPQAWATIPHDTAPSLSTKHFADTQQRLAARGSFIETPRFVDYPQFSAGERNVLACKLRMLLKSIDVDDRGLAGYETMFVSQQTRANHTPRCVFGTPIRESVLYASCKVVLGEHTHYLPTCVFASVEQICRSGITTPALFCHATSQSQRTLEHLTQIYSTSPSYGQRHSLADEDVRNVCALLKLYVRGLPEPVFSPTLWPTLCRVASGPSEPKTRIAAVQAMFHLLDRSSFATLVYILAFLHQLVLHGAQNGLTIPILAETFGPALFSPRTQAAPVSVGVLLSSNSDVPALVKNFRSPEDKLYGVRVLGWILQRWEPNQDGGISAGLLSLDIAKDGEDLAEWGARFAIEQRRESFGSDSQTVFGEGPPGDQKLDIEELDKLTAFPFPEVSVEQVPVKQVRHSIVEITDIPSPHSTRPCSPITVWSQDSALEKSSIAHAGANIEPTYVAELRHRVEAQEAELVVLRRELTSIRDQFVLPPPPPEMPSKVSIHTLGEPTMNEPAGAPDEEVAAKQEMDEDMMPTPRPPSKPRLGGPPTPTSTSTMRELMDSLQSEPMTPLFGRALRIQPAISRQNGNEILEANVFSVSSPNSPGGYDVEYSPHPNGKHFAVNPDPNDGAKEKKKLGELYATRDALKSALDAMAPVQLQLREVEQELQLRAN